MRTQRPRIYKQPGTGTQRPCLFLRFVCLVWLVFGLLQTARVGTQVPEEAVAPAAVFLALWAILSVFLVPWSAGALTYLVVNACAACHPELLGDSTGP